MDVQATSISPAPVQRDTREIVLLCNPRAGGRWKELAEILDAREARRVRRIVTDSVSDVAEALASVAHTARLLCIYGGDGTIQQILDQMLTSAHTRHPYVALIGGGTMNVTSRWCGMSGSPAANFRATIRAYESGRLLLREVAPLVVHQGAVTHYGFTFGMGPLVRLLDHYEHGSKGKLAAVGVGATGVLAAWTRWPKQVRGLLDELEATVRKDGEELPHHRFSLVFCNVTGRVNPGVKPFVGPRTRDSFHVAAYAVTKREFTMLMPLLARGFVPLDPKALLRPVSTWRQVMLSGFGKGSLPLDPRYVNGTASKLEVRSPEAIYTVDGEILRSNGEPITVELGPPLMLAARTSGDTAARAWEPRRAARSDRSAERRTPRVEQHHA
ncbi:hypothetical protein L6R52_25955 [Myxococcota bacterium]|nr:hypothetical protein [Myxococcota bacterium]